MKVHHIVKHTYNQTPDKDINLIYTRKDWKIWHPSLWEWKHNMSLKEQYGGGWVYLDRFPGSLHEVSPLLKFIVAQFELPWVRLHDIWAG